MARLILRLISYSMFSVLFFHQGATAFYTNEDELKTYHEPLGKKFYAWKEQAYEFIDNSKSDEQYKKLLSEADTLINDLRQHLIVLEASAAYQEIKENASKLEWKYYINLTDCFLKLTASRAIEILNTRGTQHQFFTIMIVRNMMELAIELKDLNCMERLLSYHKKTSFCVHDGLLQKASMSDDSNIFNVLKMEMKGHESDQMIPHKAPAYSLFQSQLLKTVFLTGDVAQLKSNLGFDYTKYFQQIEEKKQRNFISQGMEIECLGILRAINFALCGPSAINWRIRDELAVSYKGMLEELLKASNEPVVPVLEEKVVPQIKEDEPKGGGQHIPEDELKIVRQIPAEQDMGQQNLVPQIPMEEQDLGQPNLVPQISAQALNIVSQNHLLQISKHNPENTPEIAKARRAQKPVYSPWTTYMGTLQQDAQYQPYFQAMMKLMDLKKDEYQDENLISKNKADRINNMGQELSRILFYVEKNDRNKDGDKYKSRHQSHLVHLNNLFSKHNPQNAILLQCRKEAGQYLGFLGIEAGSKRALLDAPYIKLTPKKPTKIVRD